LQNTSVLKIESPNICACSLDISAVENGARSFNSSAMRGAVSELGPIIRNLNVLEPVVENTVYLTQD